MGVSKLACVFPRQWEAIARQCNRRSHDLFETQLAPLLLRSNHTGLRSGNADGFVADNTQVGNNISLLVPIHIDGRGCRRFLAIVKEMDSAVGHADQHESAAANVSRLWMYHCQREAGGYGCIDRISTLAHYLHAGISGQGM